jgi:hypothetical protein
VSFAQEAGGVGKIRKAHENGTAKGTGERNDLDFYATPPPGTLALVQAYRERLEGLDFIWEPACGDGAIARVLADELPSCRIIATDLAERGYGLGGVDFLTSGWADGAHGTGGIVMNPPFSDGDRGEGGLAARFIRHAVVDLAAPFVAVLLKAGFWHAACMTQSGHSCAPRGAQALTPIRGPKQSGATRHSLGRSAPLRALPVRATGPPFDTS